MLSAVQARLKNLSIVLASTSSRRREILSQCGIPFRTIDPDVIENLNSSDFVCVSEFVKALAKLKSEGGQKRLKQHADLIISADTVVALNHQVMGKPVDAADAVATLIRLSGKKHDVFTGVCLAWLDSQNRLIDYDWFAAQTTVYMAPLDQATIEAYVKTDEPRNKAGSYDYQGVGGNLVERIEGDYFNVLGLPLYTICQKINRRLILNDDHLKQMPK